MLCFKSQQTALAHHYHIRPLHVNINHLNERNITSFSLQRICWNDVVLWSPNINGLENKRTISCHNRHGRHSLFQFFFSLKFPFFFFFSVNFCFSKALKKSPSMSWFSKFFGSYPWHNSDNHSIQASIVVVKTSSAFSFFRTP